MTNDIISGYKDKNFLLFYSAISLILIFLTRKLVDSDIKIRQINWFLIFLDELLNIEPILEI